MTIITIITSPSLSPTLLLISNLTRTSNKHQQYFITQKTTFMNHASYILVQAMSLIQHHHGPHTCLILTVDVVEEPVEEPAVGSALESRHPLPRRIHAFLVRLKASGFGFFIDVEVFWGWGSYRMNTMMIMMITKMTTMISIITMILTITINKQPTYICRTGYVVRWHFDPQSKLADL